MRQSPTLLALLTLSATVGMASQARGETLPASAKETTVHGGSVAELVERSHRASETPATPVSRATSTASLSSLASDGASAIAPSPHRRGAKGSASAFATATPTSLSETASAFQLDRQAKSPAVAQVAPLPVDEDEELEDDDAIDTDLDIEDDALEEDIEDVFDDDLEEELEIDDEDDLDVEEEEADVEEEEERDEVEVSPEVQVLVAEVAVADPDGGSIPSELEDIVYTAVETRPGQTTTRTQIQQDINNIFATGFFSNVRAVPDDTPLGVRVTFVVNPNPVLSEVVVEGSEVLPEPVVDDIFADQYGEIINLLEFQDGILALNNWYQENGYVLAQVIAAPEITDEGVVTLQVAEGVIEDIEVQFITEEGLSEDEEGNPIRGKTRDFIILREFETEPGDVFQQNQIQSDLQEVFGLGIFEDVTLTLNPGQKDPRKVVITVNVIERNTGSVAAGVGFNFTGDLFGTLSYRQDNFGGNNQKFSAEAQLSTRDILFDVSFTDPWIGGDPYGTSYTLNGFARRSISLAFEGGENEINLDNDDRVRVNRFGAGVTFRRPLSDTWNASLGTLYQRVITTDSDGNVFEEDEAGNPLTASGTGRDDLWTVQFGVVQDLRNDPFTPTQGSVLRLGTEQSIPLGSGSIFFNRLRASYSQYIPVSFINLSEGPQALAINVQGGSIIGDFPPYEAFSLGGTNSVRGYDEGELGTGQSYLQASIEYRFPLFSFLGGALFVDAGTDIGTGSLVPGDPGPDREKPGSGFGYGAGVRIQTPLGPIRVDYGINDQGDGRLHFGIGERF